MVPRSVHRQLLRGAADRGDARARRTARALLPRPRALPPMARASGASGKVCADGGVGRGQSDEARSGRAENEARVDRIGPWLGTRSRAASSANATNVDRIRSGVGYGGRIRRQDARARAKKHPGREQGARVPASHVEGGKRRPGARARLKTARRDLKQPPFSRQCRLDPRFGPRWW